MTKSPSPAPAARGLSAASPGQKTALNIGYNDVSGTGTFSAGIVDLTGGSFNGTLGTVTIGLYAAGAGAGGAQGTLTIAAGTTTADAVILSTTGGSTATQASGNNAGILNLNGGTFTLAAAGTGITMGAGTLLGNATVNLAGGNLNLSGTNIGSAARPVTFNAQRGTLENLNELNGGGTLTKTTSGTLLLDTSDAYTGLTTVSAGVLQVANGNALGGTTNGTTVAANAALEISNNITTAAEALTLNGTGVSNGGALRNTAGSNTFTGVITVASATRINSDAGNLTLDVGAGNAISGTANVIFGGAGQVTGSTTRLPPAAARGDEGRRRDPGSGGRQQLHRPHGCHPGKGDRQWLDRRGRSSGVRARHWPAEITRPRRSPAMLSVLPAAHSPPATRGTRVARRRWDA